MIDTSDIDLYLGLDVGKGEHHATALTPAGKKTYDRRLPNSEPKLREVFTKLQAKHGTVLVIVDQVASIGALPLAVARNLGCEVAYLPGLTMRRIADLYPGGGRKKAAELDSGLRPALLALVEPDERGDPMSPLRWTTKSTRKLAVELTRQGHRVSADTVAGLLREEGFSLQANAKTIEGAQHPDRDAQFRYLNEQARDHRDAGDPVISVDSKKKELIGDYRNAGHEWQPAGQPVRVKTHDFPGQAEKAIPYGIYDMTANTGWVSIGTDHDTAAFAVASICRWWQAVGRHDYPGARRLLITADGGGSNGYRTRGWKTQLAALAAGTGLEITVCHLPPGTSKWNKIEHRLFSHITMNWRGRPLTSREVMLQTIAGAMLKTCGSASG
ncbi:hypothetical protein GCM10009612_72600 [Streptomyces beijiangensis]